MNKKETIEFVKTQQRVTIMQSTGRSLNYHAFIQPDNQKVHAGWASEAIKGWIVEERDFNSVTYRNPDYCYAPLTKSDYERMMARQKIKANMKEIERLQAENAALKKRIN